MIAAWAMLAASMAAATPGAGGLTRQQIAGATARPAAAARLPQGLRFVDRRGREVALGEVAAGRPLVLLFADFTCRHLCGPGLTLTAAALHDTRLAAGGDYRLGVIGLDPRDGAADAARFADRLRDLPDVAGATTVLRGDARTVAAATRALGYGYVHDAATDQFAHDASVYVFAADGHLAALLPELALRPEAVRAAVLGAATTHPASFGERVAHLCYGFAALTGRFDQPVIVGLRGATALALLAGGALLIRRRRRVAA